MDTSVRSIAPTTLFRQLCCSILGALFVSLNYSYQDSRGFGRICQDILDDLVVPEDGKERSKAVMLVDVVVFGHKTRWKSLE